jgi:son of sevenless-like protein
MNVIALYDYDPVEDSQLRFKAGDEIKVIKKDESGWWDGVLNDQRGW